MNSRNRISPNAVIIGFAAIAVLHVLASPLLADDGGRTSTIHVAVKQADGAGWADVNLYREHVWDEMGVTKREWRYVEDWNTSNGTCVIRVAPGKYKLTVSNNNTHQYTQPFELKGAEIRRAFFYMATIQIVAKNSNGASSAELDLYREHEWNEAGVAKREWCYVEDWNTSKGTCVVRVAPGIYRAKLSFNKKTVTSTPFTLYGWESVRLTLDTDSYDLSIQKLPSTVKSEDAVQIVWVKVSQGEVKNLAAELRHHRESLGERVHDPASFSDKAIESLIQTTTPEADENTRRVQRAAVKYLFAPSNESAERHMKDMLEVAQQFAQ